MAATLLTDELRAEVERDLAAGTSVALTAARAGVSRRTLTRWLERGRVVRRRLAVAKPRALEPPPDEAELIGLLGTAARAGNVRAAVLLLEHQHGWRRPAGRGDDEPPPVLEDAFREVDQLAHRRREQRDRGD